MNRWQFQFTARLPNNPETQTWEIGISPKKIETLVSNGDTVIVARIEQVGEVLEDPLAIFKGWARPDCEDCTVYVGRPSSDRFSAISDKKGSIETSAPTGMVFLVFVLPDGTIDFWGWRKERKADSGPPLGLDGERLGTIIWTKQA